MRSRVRKGLAWIRSVALEGTCPLRKEGGQSWNTILAGTGGKKPQRETQEEGKRGWEIEGARKQLQNRRHLKRAGV